MKIEFLAKANENLAAAQICFDNGLYNACANRAYYAALQAAIAALAHNGIKRDKIDHGQVQADFSGELIKRRKVYPARLKSYLSDMQFIRDKADYTDKNISIKISERMLTKLKELVGLTLQRHLASRYEALPRNAFCEALPHGEAEPPGMRSQAEPGNECLVIFLYLN
ncbi:HEPN domain-containing protein [Desulfonema limicola]|uniref:HEPN domain-containing protein n=1 Tax=Desulfonema limicola TaxID=45656 RepID=A0A975BB01_9BACT|nr:HEPN domain-containing protein [Desulfonema limicola]QTA82027.1 HEPN domain-containing protein [Desulfonema limicola]